MDNRFTRYIILFLAVAFAVPISAQNTLKGTVRDAMEGIALPYALINVNCIPEAAMTNIDGKFSIQVPRDTCEIEVIYNTYKTLKRKVVFSSKQRTIDLVIKLEPTATMLDPASVVSSKYETNPEKATTSIMVLSPKTAEDRNITTVDGLINTAAGVAVVDNEPQIRGGSGFSSGMGTRVMILLDDMPMLNPAAGRPMWNFIPMEDVEQVDIIKGAASVVFGSSALTGAINVHPAYPRLKPKTKVTLFAGIYDDPNPKGNKRYMTSWNDQNPVKLGVNFLHSRIIRNNFDFVIGGELFYDQGHIGPEEKVTVTRDTNKSTIGKFEQRARLNFATRYRFKKAKGLSVSLNGNYMYSKNAQSFFWYDSYENRYRTYDGSLSKFNEHTFYVDPVVKYISPSGDIHTFRNRLTYNNNGEETGAQSSISTSTFNEYQFNKNITKIGMNIVAGAMNNYVTSYGRVFNGGDTMTDPVFMSSDNFALYAQIEQRFLRKRNLIVEAGARWEFYSMENEQENRPIFRAGINYQLNKIKTAFRASIGQGYRYPAIGEKFISISVGRYGFYPNPNLVSEKSWNAEVGIMQPFMLFDFKGMFDIALFNQRYDNYIEFAMGPWGRSGNFMNDMGFKYLNIGPARIRGIDFSLMGEGKISKNITYTLAASYTFSNPETLDPDYVYFTDPDTKKEYSFNSACYDTTRQVLKYRIEHMAKVDLAFTFWKRLSIGVSANYYSGMKNVDNFFFDYDIDNPNLTNFKKMTLGLLGDLPFKGYYEYFHSKENQGALVFDARVSYVVKNVTLAVIVKNLTNKSYALRPMYVEPQRTFTFQLTYNLN